MANLVCQTVHASCYDISSKELVVNVQERGTAFHFSLGQPGTYQEGATKLFVNGDNVGLATSCSEEGSR